MTVSADVLDWGGSGETGDFGESFDAGETFLAGVFNYGIPIFATHDFEGGSGAIGRFGDAVYAVDDNDAWETFVVANGVGAVTEDKYGKAICSGEIVGLGNFLGGFNFDNISGDTSEFHGGKTRDKDVFTNSHAVIVPQKKG